MGPSHIKKLIKLGDVELTKKMIDEFSSKNLMTLYHLLPKYNIIYVCEYSFDTINYFNNSGRNVIIWSHDNMRTTWKLSYSPVFDYKMQYSGMSDPKSISKSVQDYIKYDLGYSNITFASNRGNVDQMMFRLYWHVLLSIVK